MQRAAELELLARCQHKADTGTTTAREESRIDTSRYVDPAQFVRERDMLLRRVPAAQVHASEIARPLDFVRRTTPLGELVFSRDEAGEVRVFHNSCRHRGSRLVTEGTGSARRFNCPYHGWSYRPDGSLAGVPDAEHSFPGLTPCKLGLLEVPSVEKYGFIWTCPDATDVATAESVLDAYLGDMAQSLEWLALDNLYAFDSVTRNWRANWKLIIEGGLETYHFGVAHRGTIAPYFLRNTLASDVIGGHFRSIMPTCELPAVSAKPEAERRIRDCSHIVYTVVGSCGLLVQRDHIDWFRSRPLAPGLTEMTLTSLVPDAPASMSAEQQAHWRQNFEITDTVLQEDYRIGEGQQASIENGALREMQFGRNEWALGVFNDVVDGLCDGHARGQPETPASLVGAC